MRAQGALFYALKIIDGSPYKKVTELPEVDTFKNFTADNIEAYRRRMVLSELPAEEVELRKILRNAATLFALAERRHGFNVEQLTGDKISTDGAKIFELVEAILNALTFDPKLNESKCLTNFD